MPNPSRTLDLRPLEGEIAAGWGRADAAARPLVLLAGCGEAAAAALRQLAGEAYDAVAVAGSEAVAALLAGGQVAVCCFGEGFPGEAARLFLEGLAVDLAADSGPRDASARLPPPVHLVLCSGPDPALFADLIAYDRIFYLSQEPPPARELDALVRSALRRQRSLAGALPAPAGPNRRDAGGLLRRLALQEAPEDVAALVAEAAHGRVAADRTYCLLYDGERDTLWLRDPQSASRRDESAAVGLVSFVLRSGLAVRVDRAAGDPRYEREADDPAGDGDEHFLAVPVTSPEGEVLAVLSAVRGAARPAWSAAEEAALARLAAEVTPFVAARLPEATGTQAALERTAGTDLGVFRRKVVERMLRPVATEADPLRISPAWARVSYWVLVAALCAFLLYAWFGRVDEYAAGVAVVEMGGRTDITALDSGTVLAVLVAPGQRVAAGEVLVRFEAARERADLERAERELTLQLVKRLRDPGDRGAEQALVSLRAERELARSRLDARTLVAPVAATVSDVWVRPRQYLQPGQAALSLAGSPADASARPSVAVLVPGQYRPQIRRGMAMRLEIAGYRYAYQQLTVDGVGEEVIGPAEAQRNFAPGVADGLQISGPVVLVRARLPAGTFVAEGKIYRYHDGMHGTAEIRVRSERILLALVPALKAVFEGEGKP